MGDPITCIYNWNWSYCLKFRTKFESPLKFSSNASKFGVPKHGVCVIMKENRGKSEPYNTIDTPNKMKRA